MIEKPKRKSIKQIRMERALRKLKRDKEDMSAMDLYVLRNERNFPQEGH